MLRYAKLYAELQLANIRSRSAYPFNFFMGVFAITLMGLAKLAGVWVITERVPLIDGYSFDELVFLFTLWLLPHSIFIIGFRHMWNMDYWVRNGMFDRFLVRPLNPLFQFSTAHFEIGGIGDLLAGLIGLGYCMTRIDWSAVKLLHLVAVIASGLVIEWAIYMLVCCTAFWTLQSNSLRGIVYVFFDQYIRFPVTIYNKAIQVVMTFVLPVAFINFYPSYLFFADKPEPPFADFIVYLSPLVAVVMALLAYRFWTKAINAYKGAGS